MLLLLAGLLLASAAHARRGLPIRLRMDGYIGAPEGRREMADLVIQADGKDYRFQVTNALLLSGHGLPSSLFAAVRPFRPNFFLRGPNEVLKKFTDMPPGAHMRIVGQVTRGTRNLLVSEITPRADEKK